jgi:hypothetical protein
MCGKRSLGEIKAEQQETPQDFLPIKGVTKGKKISPHLFGEGR